MSDCPGLHCPGCGHSAAARLIQAAAAAVAASTVALVLMYATEILITLGVIVGVILVTVAAVVAVKLRKAHQEGRALFCGPLAVWHVTPQKSRAEVHGTYRPRPVPIAPAARPAQGIPAPSSRRPATIIHASVEEVPR